MNGLVFGDGFLGKRIAEFLGYPLAPKFDVLNAHFLEKALDFRKPDIVINAVGRTGSPNVDWCETHKAETYRSNVIAAPFLTSECAKRGMYVVYIGTGCLYHGDNNGKGFSEVDPPASSFPQYYSRTKSVAQAAMNLIEGKVLQVRIRMPIENFPHDKSLIDKLKGYIGKSENWGFIDEPNSMTTVPYMLPAIKSLIEKQATGIYNLVNPGVISPFEIMTMYNEIVEPIEVRSMERETLDKITSCKRTTCYLNTDKLQSLGIFLPEIHNAVEACLLNYKKVFKK